MVPILVCFVLQAPRFPTDCRAAVNHVFPAAIPIGQNKIERLFIAAVVEEAFHEILRRINAALHIFFLQPLDHAGGFVFWNQTKGQRKEVCMNAAVVGADSVAVNPRFFIKQSLLKLGSY